jgi:hypothetical protein
LAQRNGVNAQALRIYNTFTDASNYERAQFNWTGNVLDISTASAGTGTARAMQVGTVGNTNLALYTNNTARWNILNTGALVAATDNSFDIGAVGATRPRSGYFSGTSYRWANNNYL